MIDGDASERRHRALLVGVWDYRRAENFDDLLGPENDVAALAEVLGSEPLGLFDVVCLRNPADEMRSEVYDFLRNATPEDDLVLYYSGHGDTDREQQLYLTSTRTRRGAPGRGLEYSDLAKWMEESRARSIVLILDCCKAGKANQKGPSAIGREIGEALQNVERGQQERAQQRGERRVRFVLAAVAAKDNAADSEVEGGLSPFTARFLDAIENAEPSVDGMVDLDAVHAHLDAIYKNIDLPSPPLFGPQNEQPVHLARRPGFAETLLRDAGLDLHAPQRHGGATVDGREIRIPTEAAAQVTVKLDQNRPSAILVGDRAGTGKTWLVCEVSDELAARGWTVLGMRPNTDSPRVDVLIEAIRTYVRTTITGTGKKLVVIDGMEWSEAWNRVVQKAAAILDTGASVLIAVDSLYSTEWHMPSGLPLPSPGTRTVLPRFVEKLVNGGYYPELAALSEADRRGYVGNLLNMCGTDLWAAVHLAPLVMRNQAEQDAAESLWRDRIGMDTNADTRTALVVVASLSWYGIWAPVDEWTEPGVAIARRLGADFTGDALKINSQFIRRALIGGPTGDELTVQLDVAYVGRRASEWMRTYLKSFLMKPNKHRDVVRMLNSFRLHRVGFDEFVTELAENGGVSWSTWQTACGSVATVAATLLAVSGSMPPKTVRAMIGKFTTRIVDGEAESASLPELLDCLQVLRSTPGTRNDSNFEAAMEALDDHIEQRLTEARHSVDHRKRLLRLVHRFGDPHAVARLRRLGPLLLKPASPLVEDDIEVLVSLAHRLSRSGTAEGRKLSAELPQWPAAIDLLSQASARTASRSASFLARWLVAIRMMGGDHSETPQIARLKKIVGSVGVIQLTRALKFCQTYDPVLGRDLLEWVMPVRGLRQRMRQASPVELAEWVAAVARTHARIGALLLRVKPRVVDRTLLAQQETQIRDASDRVGCSMLLNTAVIVEDQANLLADGFAAQLAGRLGTEFLAQQLPMEHRTSVTVHLITSFVAADLQLDDKVRKVAVDLVVDEIRRSYKERGPALALAMATSTIDGDKFLAQLRDSPRITASHLLACMKNAREPLAAAAFHRLGIVMYPDIAEKYRSYLDMGDMTERTFLRDVRDGSEPVPILKAANAIASTLMLSGDRDAGQHILSKFDELTDSTDWTRRLLSRVDTVELPEALALLLRLSPERARKLVAASQHALLLKMAGGEDTLQVFASLLNTVSRIDRDVARDLISELRENGVLDVVADRLTSDLDPFGQVAVFRHLRLVARRTGAEVLTASTTADLVKLLKPDLLRTTNPRVLAWYLEAAADRGTSTAQDIAGELRFELLRGRFVRKRRGEAPDTAYLAGVLFDLGNTYVNKLLDAEGTEWLLRNVPIDRLPDVVEVSVRQLVSVDTASLAANRFAALGKRPFTRHMREVCQSIASIAWVLHRFGWIPLDLPQPEHLHTITCLPVEDQLGFLAWLAPSEWRDDLVGEVLEKLTVDRGWQSTSQASAMCLAACLHLDRTGHLWDDDESELDVWRLALRADPGTVRILAGAIADLPPNRRTAVVARHRDLIRAARDRFAAGSRGWRARSTDLLDQLLADGTGSA